MLKNILKISLIIFSTILILFALLFLLLFALAKVTTPFKGVNAMEKDFSKNKEVLVYVKDYFSELKSDVYINSSGGVFDGTLFVMTENENFYVEIKNDYVVNAIQQLVTNGYSVIVKDDNCIIFLRWSSKDAGSGAVYSIDGHTPTESSLPFLTKLEPLNEDRWYYYEENYNEWRIRNKGEKIRND